MLNVTPWLPTGFAPPPGLAPPPGSEIRRSSPRAAAHHHNKSAAKTLDRFGEDIGHIGPDGKPRAMAMPPSMVQRKYKLTESLHRNFQALKTHCAALEDTLYETHLRHEYLQAGATTAVPDESRKLVMKLAAAQAEAAELRKILATEARRSKAQGARIAQLQCTLSWRRDQLQRERDEKEQLTRDFHASRLALLLRLARAQAAARGEGGFDADAAALQARAAAAYLHGGDGDPKSSSVVPQQAEEEDYSAMFGRAGADEDDEDEGAGDEEYAAMFGRGARDDDDDSSDDDAEDHPLDNAALYAKAARRTTPSAAYHKMFVNALRVQPY